MLTTNTKSSVYNACVLAAKPGQLMPDKNVASSDQFHLRCPRRILGIFCQDRVSNTDVLERANTPSVFALLFQRRLHWLGHVRRMEDGRLSKDILYGKFASGSRPVGRPMLRYKDVYRRDMKSAEINPDLWEAAAADRNNWLASCSPDRCRES